MYKLSENSLKKLEGVDESLVEVVKYAIQITDVDFGVSEGLRSTERQLELYNKGASQTLKSKHITGEAVDLIAYHQGRISWEMPFYCDIAEAMKEAAKEYNVKMRWGAAWTIHDIANWENSMEEAMNAYIDWRIEEGRRYFLDGPHFELMD